MTPRARHRAVVAAVVAAIALAPLVLGKFGVSLLNDAGGGALVALGLVLLTATRSSVPRPHAAWSSACVGSAA